jgi:hypothetical protein
VVDENRNGGDFDGKPGGYFVPRAVLGTTESVNANVLMGVFVVLVNARRVREDDRRRNVLLVV